MGLQNISFQRSELGPGGFEKNEHLPTFFYLSLPPVMGFEARDEVPAGHQLLSQRAADETSGRPEIRSRDEHRNMATGGLHPSISSLSDPGWQAESGLRSCSAIRFVME